jgi:GTP-binding protein
VRLSGERTFVIADVPGILEGASEGKGLGLKFLRHLERTRVLLHLVEAPEASTQRELEKRIRVIENELAEYPAGLDRLPRVLVLTKIDACPDRDKLSRWSAALRKKGHEVHAISAVSGAGLDGLMESAWRRIAEKSAAGETEVNQEEHRVYKPEPRFAISEHDGLFEVEGAEIRKWVAMTDFRNLRAVERFHLILGRMGVLAALKKRGLKPGDKVRCGDQELLWEDGKTKA